VTQEQLIAGTPSKKLHLTIGLAVIGFEHEWQATVRTWRRFRCR
jgi:hypothetical protein